VRTFSFGQSRYNEDMQGRGSQRGSPGVRPTCVGRKHIAQDRIHHTVPCPRTAPVVCLLSHLNRADQLGQPTDAARAPDARSTEEYADYLESAGLAVDHVEPHDDALSDLVRDIRAKLLGAELLAKLKQIDLPGADFDQAKALARAAADTVKAGRLGYALVVATKPG
jgi:hypothetical protein